MSGLDYCTVIGRDISLWKLHVSNILGNAGLPRDLWDFHTIVYKNEKIKQETTDEIISICETNDIKYHIHSETLQDSFLKRLYKCWNMVYDVCERDMVLRGGSDQMWSKDSFLNMYKAYVDCSFSEVILQAQTVEHHGPSRHLILDAGDTPETFDELKFDKYCTEISRDGLFTADECLNIWGKPTPTIDGRKRTEGCSWLVSKKLLKKYNAIPMPDYVLPGGITGDVVLNRKIQNAGVPDLLVGNAITYHFVAGESKPRQ